jgi:hypothetical protein
LEINPSFRRVQMCCEAKVGGETLWVESSVPEDILQDSEAMKHIEHSLRMHLMEKILERWSPVIRVRR